MTIGNEAKGRNEIPIENGKTLDLRNCEECPYFQFFLYSDTVLWYNTLMVYNLLHS